MPFAVVRSIILLDKEWTRNRDDYLGTRGKVSQISVIVLNWNGKHLLEECLGSLRRQTFRDFQTILVDNGSTDGSVEYVERRFPEVEIIALPSNVGFARGTNVGIQASNGEYVALLNNDTKMDPEWLEALKIALDTHAEVGFCASKMFFHHRPDIINAAGDVFYSFGVADHRGRGQGDGELFRRPQYVFGACAAAAIYRRAMLEEIGLFDEDFFAYDEDVDLSFRAQLMGYKCLFVPDAIIYHHHHGTSRHQKGMTLHLSRRNCLYVIVKNLPGDLLLKNLLAILLYYLAGDIWYVLNGWGRGVIKSRLDNIRNLPRMLRKRRTIQARRMVSSGYLASLLTSAAIWKTIRFNLSQRRDNDFAGTKLDEMTDE